jgi:hypothetical protein
MKTVMVSSNVAAAEKRLDQLFAEAFPTNHPAMHDYAILKMELKRLRAHTHGPSGHDGTKDA